VALRRLSGSLTRVSAIADATEACAPSMVSRAAEPRQRDVIAYASGRSTHTHHEG
jgi:hypothetical protein